MARPQDPVDPDAPEAVRRLAERLREVMDGAGYTGVRELAEAAGLSASTVSDGLNATKVPSWRTVGKILRACDVRVGSQWANLREQAEQAWKQQGSGAGEGTGEGSGTDAIGPGLHSIRPPLGELPARVRGRDELLTRLRESLDAPGDQVEVLHGLGGCGKTTLALRLARDARELGYTVFWVSADEPDRMVTALREVALELGADEEEVAEAWAGGASATDLLWGHLEASERPWLLVFDNADSPDRLAEAGHTAGDGIGWVRSSETGMTVVTTRVGTAEVWGQGTRLHPVRELSAEDGADVLIDLAGNAGTEEEARALSTRLGGLPLALRLAGSYLARTARGAGLLRQRGGGSQRTRTFDSYLEAVGDLGPELLDQGVPPGTGAAERLHRRLISRTWELSLDLLDEQGTVEARPLMRLLSCFSAEPFPVDLLDVEAASRHELLAEPPDLDRVDRALEALVDLGLVEVVELPEAFADAGPVPCLRVHRLVLDANAQRVRESTGKEREAVWGAAVEMLAAGAEHPPESTANWGWWRLLVPHVVEVVRQVGGRSIVNLRSALGTGIKTFAYLVFSGQNELVDDLASTMELGSRRLEEVDELRLTIRHRHALAFLGGLDELDEYTKILALQREVLGEEHPETLMTRHNRAVCLRRSGNLGQAEGELRVVLEARRRLLDAGSLYTAFTMNELAEVMNSRGHEEQAREHYDELANSFPDSLEILGYWSRHQIAHRLDAQGKYPEAEVEFRAVLADLEEKREYLRNHLLSGPADEVEGLTEGQILQAIDRHTATYQDLVQCLARNLRAQKKPEALTQYEQYMAMLRERYVRDEPRVISGWHEYGDILKAFGRSEEAKSAFRKALALRLGKHDERDSDVLQDRHCLAHALHDLERFDEAAEQLHLVYTAFDDLLGPTDPKTVDSLGCLAFSIRKKGDQEEALRLYRLLYLGECEVHGPGHSLALIARQWAALLAYELGGLSTVEARAEIEEVLTLLPEAEGTDEQLITVVRERLAKLEP